MCISTYVHTYIHKNNKNLSLNEIGIDHCYPFLPFLMLGTCCNCHLWGAYTIINETWLVLLWNTGVDPPLGAFARTNLECLCGIHLTDIFDHEVITRLLLCVILQVPSQMS